MAPGAVFKRVQTRLLVSVILAILLETVQSLDVTHMDNDSGTIKSPAFPKDYPNNYHHLWRIRVSPNFLIRLEFDSLDLEECLDHVHIFDGNWKNNSRLASFCSNEIPPTILSSTNVIYIEMKTDNSVTRKGFSAKYTTFLNTEGIDPRESAKKLTQYFLSTIRHKDYRINKWSMDITRSAVSLFLSDPNFFATGNHIGEEIAYELSLQLMSKLVMRKRIATNDLALFVNAMTVSCINPRKFFGVDIVGELLRRIVSTNNTNPFFILTVCNAGEIIEAEYVHKLQKLFETPLRPSWTGTQAMVIMALKCISRQANINLNVTLAKMVAELKDKQQTDGTFEDLKSTALFVQALMEAESYKTDFKLTTALKSIYKDVENTDLSTEMIYYILPTFHLKTLLDINSNHCENFIQTDLEEMKTLMQEDIDEQIQVQISIIIGEEMDFARTWKIKVPSNFSLYQAMENISSSDPDYKVRYAMVGGKPYIAALSHFEDSVENGLFWFIYKKPLSSFGDLILLENSPVDIRLNETDELVLWYNSGSPPSTQYGRSDTTYADTITSTTDPEIVLHTTYPDSTYVDLN